MICPYDIVFTVYAMFLHWTHLTQLWHRNNGSKTSVWSASSAVLCSWDLMGFGFWVKSSKQQIRGGPTYKPKSCSQSPFALQQWIEVPCFLISSLKLTARPWRFMVAISDFLLGPGLFSGALNACFLLQFVYRLYRLNKMGQTWLDCGLMIVFWLLDWYTPDTSVSVWHASRENEEHPQSTIPRTNLEINWKL